MTEKQRQLAAENHQLIYSFLHKYDYDIEDFYDLAAIGLCKAARSYKDSMGNFSTLAYKCMFNEIAHYFVNQGAARRVPSHLIMHYDAKIHSDDEGEFSEILNCMNCDNGFENDAITDILIDICKVKLTDRDRIVFEMLMDGYTTREIGKVIGCSNMNITNIRRKIESRLRRMLV